MSRSRNQDRGGLTVVDQSAQRKRELAVICLEPLFFSPLDRLPSLLLVSIFQSFILHIMLLRFLVI